MGAVVIADLTPRLRMFAGPNGSGKSTMKALLRPDLLMRYINADDIETAIRGDGFFDFAQWQVETSETEIRAFLSQSSLLAKANLREQAANLDFRNGKLFFESGQINSYFASVLADWTRRQLVSQGRSFTFETVMSSPDKIEFMRHAQKLGFRTYLYFVATEDAEINIDRVANRVSEGGHNVPTDKIIARYHRSLKLLADAIRASDRAYVFDNSGRNLKLIAEFDSRKMVKLHDVVPVWFITHVLEKVKT